MLRTSALCALLAWLFSQAVGHAAPPPLPDALPYSKGYLVTGNYIAGGVDFNSNANPADSEGLATGTIPIGNPATAGGVHLVGAYLYWEAVHPFPVTLAGDPTIGVKFRGAPLEGGNIRVSTKQITSAGATCWGSAGQGSFAVSMFRANVLYLMPKQFDAQGNWTGKYIVNSDELPTNGKHTVTLPEKTGDSAIQSAGATLFLVYQRLHKVPTNPNDPPQQEPLRKIVVYDGLYTAYNNTNNSGAEAAVMSQQIRGFYKSVGTALVPSAARITHLVGTGGNNQTERITVTSAAPLPVTIGPPPNSADPFPQSGPSSDRSWATATYDLPTVMPGTTNLADRFGETVTTTVAASNTSPAACRAWGAVIFSTEVLDDDDDGLPDGLEDAAGGLKDPDGTELPNLNAMGGGSHYPPGDPKAGQLHPDLFVEFNVMKAPGDNPNTPLINEGTKYGSLAAPYPNGAVGCDGVFNGGDQSCTDTLGHQHMPTPADLKRIGDRYMAHGITPHFDVGRLTGNPNQFPNAYHNLGVIQHQDWVDDYTSTVADSYLVGNGVGANVASLARGGEIIRETACDPAEPECLFPDFPGTVGWKLGLLALRNAPVGNNGEELPPDLILPVPPNAPPGTQPFNWRTSDNSEHRLRFDRVRRPYFHYLLSAHTRGTPNILPCLVDGVPTGYGPGATCTNGPNPAYHVPFAPSGGGGLADLPGRNVLLSMGLWDEFVGRPYARQATIFHELGHNLGLWHSGWPAVFGNGTATQVEPNCKPNFPSTMSYLFQLHGLFDINGLIQVDYSGGELASLNETALADGQFVSTPLYRPAWYAPAGSSLATAQAASAATRFCPGVRFGPGEPAAPMARVESDTFENGTWTIDWDGDRAPDSLTVQDANFDGEQSAILRGYDDWTNIRLDQISTNGITGGSDDFVFLVGSDDLVSIIGSDDFNYLIGGDELNFIIGGDELASIIGGDELAMLIGGDELAMLIGGDDLNSLIGGDDLAVIIGGDDLATIIGSDDLASIIGSDQEELTYRGAKELGRVAPYQLTACVVGNPGCTQAPKNSPLFGKVNVRYEASTVGHIVHYQWQRKKAGDPDTAYQDAGTSQTNSFVDPANLPRNQAVTYRGRGVFDDGLPATSPWSRTVTITP